MNEVNKPLLVWMRREEVRMKAKEFISSMEIIEDEQTAPVFSQETIECRDAPP